MRWTKFSLKTAKQRLQSWEFALTLQIRAARHSAKTDWGDGVAVVGYTCCAFLVMVGGPAINTVTQATLRQNKSSAEQIRLTPRT